MAYRILKAVGLSLPGIGLAFVAKPLSLGGSALFLGILLAVLVPVVWLMTPAKKDHAEPDVAQQPQPPSDL